MKMKKLAVQFFKFGIVGLSNTAIYFAIYYALLIFGVHYLAANILAFSVGTINAFYWNRKFVFTESKKNGTRQFAKVYTAYGFTFLLGMGTLFLMVDILGISKYIAPLINVCITVPLNFLINKFWAFK